MIANLTLKVNSDEAVQVCRDAASRLGLGFTLESKKGFIGTTTTVTFRGQLDTIDMIARGLNA